MVPDFISMVPVLKDSVHYKADRFAKPLETYILKGDLIFIYFSESVHVNSFTFMIGYANATTWTSRVNYMNLWRDAADRFILHLLIKSPLHIFIN